MRALPKVAPPKLRTNETSFKMRADAVMHDNAAIVTLLIKPIDRFSVGTLAKSKIPSLKPANASG